MLYYDTNSRLQFAREQADRLAEEMRRSRHLTPDEVGHPRRGSFGSALAGRVERLRRRSGAQAPAYNE